MSAIIILLVSIVILVIGYIFYGAWLAKQWGIDIKKPTPAHTMEDGNDYVPAKAPVLLGHHFSSIAGAGPINGPIQAAVFGWVPVLLWILIGGIFIGGVHDFGSLFASIRHRGQSVGTIIAENIGERAKKLFIVFAYLTLLLVVAAFASIVAGTFDAFPKDADGNIIEAAAETNSIAATISALFIVISIAFGFTVYRRKAPIGISTIIGIVGIVAIIVIGINFPFLAFSKETWMIIVGIYILIASVTPVWILLQPRDYLSSFLLYGMMIAAVIGVIFANPTMNIEPFYGFGGLGGKSYLFPVLFITVACGAISGFHSLVGSGTTAKQLDSEKDAKLIGYGSMLIECALAVVALIAVGFLTAKGGAALPEGTPTQIFAKGIATMIQSVGGENVYPTVYALIILSVSAFALTSLDTATRLARYMFQEFFLKKGETPSTVTGSRKILVNPWVGTIITVALGILLGYGGYAAIWPLFGASNQLLAGLGLLAIASWLNNIGRNNKMLYAPMVFMLIATVSSLGITCWQKVSAVAGGDASTANVLQLVFAVIEVVLALIVVWEGIQVLSGKRKISKEEVA